MARAHPVDASRDAERAPGRHSPPVGRGALPRWVEPYGGRPVPRAVSAGLRFGESRRLHGVAYGPRLPPWRSSDGSARLGTGRVASHAWRLKPLETVKARSPRVPPLSGVPPSSLGRARPAPPRRARSPHLVCTEGEGGCAAPPRGGERIYLIRCAAGGKMRRRRQAGAATHTVCCATPRATGTDGNLPARLAAPRTRVGPTSPYPTGP